MLLLLGLTLGFWPEPSHADDSPQLAFAQIQINDHPASLLFATALDFTCLLNTGASRLGVQNPDPWLDIYKVSIGLSAPTRVSQAGQTQVTPLLLARVPLWARPILHLLPFRLDGLLGWPEVHDNILVFDYEARTIRRVEQLPPETAGWVKLKVAPADSLLLELPQSDGSRGLLSLNIGLETGRTAIRLSAGPWQAWHAAHPRAAAISDVNLGPLTLTGVTVKELPAREADDLLEANPGVPSVWQLGSAALAHLDLVVDGIHGWAYLHPRSSPSSPSSSASPSSDGNWQLADNVRLSRDNFFVYSGWYKWCGQNFAGAWADYHQALRLNPQNVGALSGCGSIQQIQGDFSEAVSNYDRVIELRPDNSAWERLDRQTLLWRLPPSGAKPPPALPHPPAAHDSATVLPPVVVSARQPAGSLPWSQILRLYLDGRLDEKALLAAAKQKHGERSVAGQKAQVWYYLGQARLRQGDPAGAREWFKKCQSASVKEDNEYYFAVAELARLDSAAK